jgi:hypothetical protein
VALASLFSLFGWTFALYALVRKHNALTLLAALSGMTLAVYLGGCLGVLRPTAILVYWGGLASLGICLGLAARRRISLAGLLMGPEMWGLLVLSVLHLYLFRDASLFYWDEFSHWALSVKEMFWRGELYRANANMTHAYYPPGAALWLYYVTSSSRFSEPVLYFAQFVLALIPTFILYKNTRFRQPHWLLAALAAQIFLLAVLGHGVANLLVDHVLAAWFGGILVLYLSDRYTPGELLLFVPALAVLALIKDVGAFLACAAGLFIVAHRLWLSGESGPFWGRRRLLAVCLLLLLAGPLASLSWSAWRQAGVTRAPGKSLSLERVRNALSSLVSPPAEGKSEGERIREKAHRATVAAHFREALLRQPLARMEIAYDFNEYNYGMLQNMRKTGRLGAAGWFGFFLVLSAAAWASSRQRPDRSRTIVFAASFLSVVCALYGGMLLYLFMMVFDWGKGEALASYDRYCNIVVMPLVFVGLALHFPLWTVSGGETRGVSRYFVFPLLLALYLFEPPYWKSLYWQPENNFFRKDIKPLVDLAHAALGKDDSLYVVFPVEENGQFRIMATYDFSPIQTTVSPADVLNKDQAGFAALLAANEHLLFMVLDHPALARFKAVTPDGLGSRLYRVHREGGDVWLEPRLPAPRQ